MSRAELLSDTAVYRRTQLGQKILTRTGTALASTQMRILARFNGYTDLRRLIDLSPDEAQVIGSEIVALLDQELIELVRVL